MNLTLKWEGESGDGKRAFVVADQNDGWRDLRIEVDTDDCDSDAARAIMQEVIDRCNQANVGGQIPPASGGNTPPERTPDMTDKRKSAAGCRTARPPCSAARWHRICKSMGKGYDRTSPENVERTIALIFKDYGRILNRMQDQCQKYRLGLAGNHVAHVICDEIDRIHGTPNKGVTGAGGVP